MIKKRVFITGGHVTPAEAVIDEFLKTNDLEIYFLGRKYTFEGDLAESAEYQLYIHDPNIHFLTLTTGRLQRSFTRYTIPSLLKVFIGITQSIFWLLKYRPKIVLSFGGYLAVPVCLSAWFLHVPVVTHEQTLVSGLSNKIIAKIARKILVSWHESAKNFPVQKVIYTGNPIRKETFEVNATDRSNDFQKIRSESPKTLTLYITCGNQGAHAINLLTETILSSLLNRYLLIWQTGRSEKFQDQVRIEKSLARFPDLFRSRCFLFDYVSPQEIGWVFKEADVIIGRSGANTVFEIAALGKPAILIPLPWSGGGEQEKNAEALARFGGTTILRQDQTNPETFLNAITEVTKNLKIFAARAQKAKTIVNLNAATEIVSIVRQEIT